MVYANGLLHPGCSWWRHQMETFYALLALCTGNSLVTGEFPSQRPVTRSFDAFFHLCLNKRLSITIVILVIWDAIAIIMTSLECLSFVIKRRYNVKCTHILVMIVLILLIYVVPWEVKCRYWTLLSDVNSSQRALSDIDIFLAINRNKSQDSMHLSCKHHVKCPKQTTFNVATEMPSQPIVYVHLSAEIDSAAAENSIPS